MSHHGIAEPYRRRQRSGPYDAIVVGSGIGGLAAAALLAKHGRRRVLVLERHYAIGGYTHVFRRPGYEWDVGVHYIGDTAPGGLMRALFDDLTDGQLEWEDMGAIVERIRIGDETYVYPKGEAALRAELVRRFPSESGAIDRYFALVHRAVAALQDFFATKTFPRLIGAVVKPMARRRFFRLADRTTREVLRELTTNEKLIGVLTGQFGAYGLPPSRSSFAIHALVTQHYFGGGFFPVGGAGRIAAAIAPVIRAAGGELLVNAEVEEIVVERDRAVGVRMAEDGAELRAPLVISDAGVANTLGRLVPRAVAERHRLGRALDGMRPSVAHACLYVGLKGTAAELGLERANLWIYPDEHHDRTAEIAADPAAIRFAYVSFPSAKDPDFERRCPGKSTIDVMTFLPYDAFARWQDTRWRKRGAEYDAFKQAIAERLLDLLSTHVPQVRGAVEVAELSTPLSSRNFTAHAHGEIYGLEHTPARFRNPFLRPATPLRGLLLTGADIATAGVAGALLGGAMCASAILRKNLVEAARSGGTRAAA
ncbi:MAG: NAD(P)/FAD-dependent oxidoreductase [Deltaproteobacteria bacterium]|nr:NAD(P)/FAD-dependent oxidoreductase [Deltaproteobacteria bacterium]